MEQSGGSNNVGFIKGDINNHVDVDCRVQIREGDEESAISYLCEKKWNGSLILLWSIMLMKTTT